MLNSIFLGSLGLGATESIMVIFVFIACFALWLGPLIEVSKSEFKEPSNKTNWIICIILLGFIGGLLYYFIGRKQRVIKN